MNLEQLIDEVYGEYQAKIKAEFEAKKLQEQQEIEEAILEFRSDFDVMISPNLQKELGINICAVYQSPVYVFAEFVYKGEKLTISRWGGSYQDWQLQRNSDFLCGGKTDGFLNLLLIELGKIRDSAVEPEPEQMTLEQAAGTLDDCLALAEDVYAHRHDFIHNPEEFGSSLKAAICLMSKLLDELAESEGQAG
ncbi:hypothetical protein [Nostoc sp. GT001]|uniref:hypothetical protein n=1 Tax=Nostoc sp. GT001 TaxID=3056647 RepID=UPI0025AA9C71|nr:hypothetical protein [Nostoc sp. GT001]MDM9583153.1 hypothetical protein [Nostoc sp. GT001]